MSLTVFYGLVFPSVPVMFCGQMQEVLTNGYHSGADQPWTKPALCRA